VLLLSAPVAYYIPSATRARPAPAPSIGIVVAAAAFVLCCNTLEVALLTAPPITDVAELNALEAAELTPAMELRTPSVEAAFVPTMVVGTAEFAGDLVMEVATDWPEVYDPVEKLQKRTMSFTSAIDVSLLDPPPNRS